MGTDRQRLDDAGIHTPIPEFLEKIKMYESGYLNRAAVLLFTNHPEEKIGGAVVKIAYFQNDADILFQDEVCGDLLTQSDKTLGLLMSKYTWGMIHYEGMERLDVPPVPRAVRREAYNPIVHKDYGSSNPSSNTSL